MSQPRFGHRYTPYFCEENVWWLAHEARCDVAGDSDSWVCLFTNFTASIALMNQRAAVPGSLMAWDYHVVYAVQQGSEVQVFDLDSRLPFPSPWPVYFAATFPDQAVLPPRWRAMIRQIPAESYLARFCSDRHHMVGRLPAFAFPDYPPICPDDESIAVDLDAYRDLDRLFDDGSLVATVDQVWDGPATGKSGIARL